MLDTAVISVALSVSFTHELSKHKPYNRSRISDSKARDLLVGGRDTNPIGTHSSEKLILKEWKEARETARQKKNFLSVDNLIQQVYNRH
jgi:hypothetical protein